MDSPKTILKTIKAAQRILIPLHLRPDGDMIGSALACYHFLKSLGKKADLVSADPIPSNFFFLPGAKRIKNTDPANLDLAKFDLIFLADNGSPFRYSRAKRIELPSQTLLINIDHHSGNREFGDLNYVDDKAAASTEILYDLFKFWKVKITPSIASCLLTGIYTDTGGFLHGKTSANSLLKAGDLIKKGADRGQIVEKAFRSWPPKTPQIWAAILNNTRVRKGIAYSQISHHELRRIGCSLDELSAARGFGGNALLLAIDKIKVALIFTEERPKAIRVSLRSKGRFSVEKIARKMGGGGHFNAAAFDYQGPLKQAVTKTLRMVGGRL
ncbi:MAG: bifunctional oligoribonuclease/PAP phosphatase NrnA [Patescibacteria group bacterium]|nr:MAG: bifunctional oligoribonuclease/PAP phosphatase NrnA [Patescibacteria group bacterium]